MRTILITLVLILLISCKTNKIVETPGAVITKPDGFRSINTYTYVVEYKDGSKISETVTVKNGSRPALDIVFDMVEKHIADTSKVKIYFVKPILNK